MKQSFLRYLAILTIVVIVILGIQEFNQPNNSHGSYNELPDDITNEKSSQAAPQYILDEYGGCTVRDIFGNEIYYSDYESAMNSVDVMSGLPITPTYNPYLEKKKKELDQQETYRNNMKNAVTHYQECMRTGRVEEALE